MFVFRKLLDLEKKVATTEPIMKSLSVENEMLKNKLPSLLWKLRMTKNVWQLWRRVFKWRMIFLS